MTIYLPVFTNVNGYFSLLGYHEKGTTYCFINGHVSPLPSYAVIPTSWRFSNISTTRVEYYTKPPVSSFYSRQSDMYFCLVSNDRVMGVPLFVEYNGNMCFHKDRAYKVHHKFDVKKVNMHV